MNIRLSSFLLFLCTLSTAWAADTVISNVSIASSGQLDPSTGTLAQAFDTGAESTRLTNIRLRLTNPSVGATAGVQLWSGPNDVPETLVDTLATIDVTSPNLFFTFSVNRPQLAANTRYWVVVSAVAGTFSWDYTSDATVSTSLGMTLPSVRAVQGSGNWSPLAAGDRQVLSVTVVRQRVTNASISGPGSLSQALLDAHDSPGPDTITFDPSLSGATITPTSSSRLGFSSEVTIDGTALAVPLTLSASGDPATNLVNVGSTVVIKGLNITGATTTSAVFLNSGGGRALTLERCTLSGNSIGGGFGGALANNGSNNGLTIRDCTFSNNNARAGGAIFTNGPMTLINCTISGNASTGTGSFDGGGAIWSASAVTLIHCTIVENGSAAGGGGIFTAGSGSVSLTNCVVAGNTASGTGPDVGSGSVSLSGVNFIGDVSGSGQSASATLFTGDPLLAPLGAYGGRIKTMPPLAGSPLIDVAAAGSEVSDQRGASRTTGNGSAPDLGAVELGQIVVNTSVDENDGVGTGGISLRDAIAVNTPFQAELIRFDPAVFSGATPTTNTISLTTSNSGSAIAVNRLACVDASNLPAGVTIDDGTATSYRLFQVTSGGLLSMRSVTLSNGGGADFANAVSVNSGGAILVDTGGALALTSCTLSGNVARDGGAILAVANTKATLTQCTLAGNQTAGSNGFGGAIFNGGALTLTHCTLTDNHASGASGSGGALYASSGTVKLTASIVSGNTATVAGPDAFADNAAVITTTGVNFIGDPTGSGLTANATLLTTAQNGDAKLDPAGLAARGGPTKTIALLRDSPARDAATGSTATADQRGFPKFGVADLGAYERQLGAIASQQVDEDNSTGALAFPVGNIGPLSASSSVPSLVSTIIFDGSGGAHTVAVTPAPNANGSAAITVTDSLSGETQSFVLTVNPVNDPPFFTKGPDQNVLVNAGAQALTGWATGISPGVPNESGQSLTFNVTNDNPALFSAQPAVASDGTLTLTPAGTLHGVATVTVTLRDDGTPPATSGPQSFVIAVRLVAPQSSKVLAAGGATPDAAPGASNNTAGLPADAVLAGFGLPATSDAGDLAFVARWTSNSGKVKGTGLFLNDQCLAIVGGDASAIGGTGAKWSSFTDPVVEGGRLACLARLSTGATAVVCNFTGAALQKIALTGEQAPDAGDATFKRITAVALRGGAIGLLAQLGGGTGSNKVTSANDIGIWARATGGPLRRFHRDSAGLGGGKIVGSFVSLAPGDGSAGSGRGWLSSDGQPLVLSLNNFTDKTRGIGFGRLGAFSFLAKSGDTGTNFAPALSGAAFESFRLPAMNDAYDAAFYATMRVGWGGVTRADAGGIFATAANVNGSLAPSDLIAQLGKDAGTTNGKFSVLKDPVLAQDGALAFPATIRGSTIKGAAARTLWWRPASGGAVQLLAQGGGRNGQPTDLPAGAQWNSFGTLAIAANRGPIFTATLVPGAGGVLKTNASGVWAMDFAGTLRTLFRTGDKIPVDNNPANDRTLRSFALLRATVGNTGVTRSFNDAAQIVWLATFDDKSQAIVTTEVP